MIQTVGWPSRTLRSLMTQHDYDEIHSAAIARTVRIPVDAARTAVKRLTRQQLAGWVALVNASDRTTDTITAITATFADQDH